MDKWTASVSEFTDEYRGFNAYGDGLGMFDVDPALLGSTSSMGLLGDNGLSASSAVSSGNAMAAATQSHEEIMPRTAAEHPPMYVKRESSSDGEELSSEEEKSEKPRRKRKRQQVKAACANCRRSKTACDDVRPCTRCLSRGWECVDPPKQQAKETLKLKPMAMRSASPRCVNSDSGRGGDTSRPAAPAAGILGPPLPHSIARHHTHSSSPSPSPLPPRGRSHSPPHGRLPPRATSEQVMSMAANGPGGPRSACMSASSMARVAHEGSGVISDEMFDQLAHDAASSGGYADGRRRSGADRGRMFAQDGTAVHEATGNGESWRRRASPYASQGHSFVVYDRNADTEFASLMGRPPPGAIGPAHPQGSHDGSDSSEGETVASCSPRSPDSDSARLEIEMLREKNLSIRRQNENLRKEIARLRGEALTGTVYSLTQLANCRVAKSLWDARTVKLAAFNECFVMLSQRPRALLVGPAGFSCPNLFKEEHLPKCAQCVALFKTGSCVLARMTQLWNINGRDVPFKSMIRCVMNQSGDVTHMLMYSIPTSEFRPGTEYQPEVLEWKGEARPELLECSPQHDEDEPSSKRRAICDKNDQPTFAMGSMRAQPHSADCSSAVYRI